MCYGENGTVKFFETLADNVFGHNYSMMQIKKKINDGMKYLAYLNILFGDNHVQNSGNCKKGGMP
jgi:hypothetical protein